MPKMKECEWATLPGHHLPNEHLALEDEACEVHWKVVLHKFGLDKLLDIRGKVLNQDGMCAVGREAEKRTENHVVTRNIPSSMMCLSPTQSSTLVLVGHYFVWHIRVLLGIYSLQEAGGALSILGNVPVFTVCPPTPPDRAVYICPFSIL